MAGKSARPSIADIRRRLSDPDDPPAADLLRVLRDDPRRGARCLYEAFERRRRRWREARAHLDSLLRLERRMWSQGVRRVAGVDEAGVGPLAGPVVAAAVVFPPGTAIDGVDDSKRLTPDERGRLAVVVRRRAAGVGVGRAEVEEIDALNIYHASLLAMRRAVEALPEPPDHLLVDARTILGLSIPQEAITGGDALHFSIAAASIIAKTERDALMLELDRSYPLYGFARHKGYGTAAHRAALERYGPCPVHRVSFGCLREPADRRPPADSPARQRRPRGLL